MSMTKIEHIEVTAGAGQSSIEFTSIPSTYTDLLLVTSIRAGSGGGGGLDIYLTFNSSSANYSSRDLYGNGSSPTSSAGGTSNIRIGQTINAATANTFANSSIYIPNYTGSQAKSVSTDFVSENNATLGFQFLVAGLWNDSSAIDTITLDPESTFVMQQYSSATLYGITAGSDGTTTVS